MRERVGHLRRDASTHERYVCRAAQYKRVVCCNVSSVPNGDAVAFGCNIVLKNLDTDEEVIYMLVGPYESDIQKGRISMSSPLGRALLGKSVGDEVAFKAPGGERTYEVVKIE